MKVAAYSCSIMKCRLEQARQAEFTKHKACIGNRVALALKHLGNSGSWEAMGMAILDRA